MSISEPTKRRLVALLKLLEVVKTQKITSVEISRISGWKDSLVRFDLKSAGISGGKRVADRRPSGGQSGRGRADCGHPPGF